jgi:hypothetical protein
MMMIQKTKSEAGNGWTRKNALEEVQKALEEKELETKWTAKVEELKELRRPKKSING